MNVALRRDEHEIRIAHADEHRRNLLRRVEPDVSPCAARVVRPVDAVALVDRPAGDDVAGARVDDVRVRRRDFD